MASKPVGLRVESSDDTLRFEIRYRTPLAGKLFLGFWWLLWLYGGLASSQSLVGIDRIVTALFWSAGLIIGLYGLIRAFSGGEVIQFSGEAIVRTYRFFGFSFPRVFPAADVTRLDLAPRERPVGSSKLEWLTFQGDEEANALAFRYGGKVVRMGTGLTDDEGERILLVVRRRYPHYLES